MLRIFQLADRGFGGRKLVLHRVKIRLQLVSAEAVRFSRRQYDAPDPHATTLSAYDHQFYHSSLRRSLQAYRGKNMRKRGKKMHESEKRRTAAAFRMPARKQRSELREWFRRCIDNTAAKTYNYCVYAHIDVKVCPAAFSHIGF